MKSMKAKELQSKSIEELQQMLVGLQAELFRTRRDLVFRRETDTSSVKTKRHNIARIMTVITQKQKEVSA